MLQAAASDRSPHGRCASQENALARCPNAISTLMASSFETHRFAMLLTMRSQTLMVRSASSRVSNHEATDGNDPSELKTALVVGFGRQEIDFVIGRDAHDLGRVREVVQLVEQGFQLLHRRNPEQRA